MNATLRVLHKSENFIVVNKPFDLIINSDDPKRPSVHALMKNQFNGTFNEKLKHGYYACHRLDYSTSGILVVPLNKKAVQAACQAFEASQASKTYLAIVRGICDQNEYHIQLPIGNDTRPEYSSLRMQPLGSEFVSKPRNAETTISVISRGTFDGSPATKVLLKPLTGRRHQLRLHCHSIGHTIVGDYTYSDRTDIDPPRMYLHAFKLWLPNSVEDLNLQTEDPFAVDDLYKENEVVITNILSN